MTEGVGMIEKDSVGDVDKIEQPSTSSEGGPIRTVKMEQRMRTAGMIAAVSALFFAIPHFWFWLGISLAYPGDLQNTPKTAALLAVGGFAVLAAIYAIVLTHTCWARRLPASIVALPAWGGSVGFTLWGLAYFGLQVQLAFENAVSSQQYFASDTNPNAIWGLYWYSLFIIWGLSLGSAAFYYHRLMKRQDKASVEELREDRNPVSRRDGESGGMASPMRKDSDLSQKHGIEGRQYGQAGRGDA